MIKEFAAALGGVLTGLVVFLLVFLFPGVANSPYNTSTGLYRSQPITGPIYAPDSLRFSYGASGVYSGILSGLFLMLLAIGAGILVAYVGLGRLKEEKIS